MEDSSTTIARKITRANSVWKTDYFILFFIWPFVSLVYAIKNYKRPYAKNIVWLFTAFYGLTMVFVSDALDGARIIASFENASRHGFVAFQHLFTRGGELDVLQPLVIYVVSWFTTDSRILFGVMGLIFGYFFSRNVWLGIELIEGRLNRYAIIFIFLFAMIIPIWEINGFRMWTAAHVFFFGVSRQLITGERKYAFFAVLSPLIHFSFIFAVVAYFGYFLVKRLPLNLIFSIFILSVLVQEIYIDIREFRDYAPEAFHSEIDGYGNIEWAEARREAHQEMRWWAKYQKTVLEYFMVLVMSLAFVSCKKNPEILKDKSTWNFFSFSLWFAALARFLAAFPFGDNYRFVIIANLFLSLSLAIIYGGRLRTFKIPLQYLITFLIIAFYSLVGMRMGFDRMGIATLISNPFTVWFFDGTKPLIVFIKQLLGF